MIRRTVTWALAALLVTALLAGCDPFGLRDVLEAASRSQLSIDPRNVTMPAGATLKFAADGGVPPYVFSVAGDGSIDAATGEFTAPLSAGAATITVTDAAGANADTDIAIEPLGSGLHIVPSNISVVVNASVTFTAVGGTPPYSYAMGAMGSGSPSVDLGTGQYTAGGSIGLDQVIVTDALANTATATVNVVAVASAVDYDVVSVAALPASGVAGAAIGGGYTFSVRNVGTGGGAAALGWRVYLSTNATLDGGDLVVAEGSNAALPAGDTAVIALAGTWPTGPVGGGFLVVALDAVDDTTPANDIETSPFTLQPRPVDYDVTSVAWTAGTYTGDTVTGTFTVKNVGAASGASTIYWWAYASIDTAIDGADVLLMSSNRAALGAGSETTPIGITGTWPTTPASYRLLVHVVAADDIASGNDIDWSSPVVVTGAPPEDVNYAAAAPVNTGGTTTGGSLAGTFVLSKAGADPGTQTVHWTVYRSDDATLEPATDPVVAVGTHPPMISGSDVVPFGGTWGANPGTKHLFAVISAGDDTNGTDNTSPGTAVAVAAPNVDYLVNSFSETSGAVAGDPITGTLTLKNNGTAGGARPVAWTVYLSPDATLDPAGDFVVDAGSLGALAAGATSAPTPFDGTWPLVPAAPWTWWLYLVISAPDDVNAGNDTSGTLVRATSAPQADYDVQVVAHTGGTTAGQAFTGEFTVRNLGPHAGTQSVPWSAYLSTNATWDAGVDTLVDSGVTAALANGATSAPIPFDGAWPSGAATWYLVVVVDAGDDPAAANDWAASGSVAVTVPNVNYDVLSVTNTGASIAGGPLAAEFTLKNIGTAAGSRTVYWTAYRSDDAILTVGVDAVIDSGTTAPLGAGVTSAALPVANTWPAAIVTKNYWLFVRIFVADDVLATDDTESSSMLVVNPPNVDYDVVTVNNTGGLVAGGALSGTFQVQNIGTVNGSRTLYWTVYRSLDLVFTPGVDPVVDSGSVGGLTAGNSANPTFSGTWPEDTVPRTYYWYVRLVAADDIAAANDEQFSGALVVNPAVAFPDYRVESPVYQVTGTPGAALGGVHTFRIQNAAANPGTKTITWRVYASRDATLDGADTLLATSSIGPLGASATTGDIAYGGTWPAFGSFYRLIVSLDADDDTNPANDGWVSGVIEAVEILAPEGAEINSDIGPTLVPLLNVTDRGVVMDEGRYVRISGTMDAKNAFDTYKFALGADATRLQIALTWSTGDDGCDFYLWDEAGAQGSALSLDINVEEVTFINLTPGAVYYIGIKFLQNHSGQPYQLTVYAEPD